MSVVDVFGPGFAMLYGCLLVLAAVAALALRTGLQGVNDDAPDAFAPVLHPVEVAYLAGGVRSAAETAVASVRRRALVSDNSPRERVDALREVLSQDVLPVERELYAAVARHGGAVEQAVREVGPMLAPVRQRLTWLKLLVPEPSARRVRRLQLALFGALVLLGAWHVGGATIVITVARLLLDEPGHPAAPGTSPDYVVLALCGIAVWLTAYVRPMAPYRNRRGQWLLDQLRTKHIALLWKLRHQSHRLPVNDYVLAVALFGEDEHAAGEAYAAVARIARRRTPPGVPDDQACDGGSSPRPVS